MTAFLVGSPLKNPHRGSTLKKDRPMLGGRFNHGHFSGHSAGALASDSHNFRLLMGDMGMGSKFNRHKTAGSSPCFHLPGSHFGHLFLTRSHIDSLWTLSPRQSRLTVVVKTNRIGAPPILAYFSGDWDVHWGCGLLVYS